MMPIRGFMWGLAWSETPTGEFVAGRGEEQRLRARAVVRVHDVDPSERAGIGLHAAGAVRAAGGRLPADDLAQLGLEQLEPLGLLRLHVDAVQLLLKEHCGNELLHWL